MNRLRIEDAADFCFFPPCAAPCADVCPAVLPEEKSPFKDIDVELLDVGARSDITDCWLPLCAWPLGVATGLATRIDAGGVGGKYDESRPPFPATLSRLVCALLLTVDRVVVDDIGVNTASCSDSALWLNSSWDKRCW